MRSGLVPSCYWKLHAVPSGSNVEKIDLVNLVFVDHDGQLRGILESHFADPERPQHYLQEILVGNVLVSFDPRDSRTEDRGRYALLSVDVVYLVPEIDEKLKVLWHRQQRLVVLVEFGECGQEVVFVQADRAYLIFFSSFPLFSWFRSHPGLRCYQKRIPRCGGPVRRAGRRDASG